MVTQFSLQRQTIKCLPSTEEFTESPSHAVGTGPHTDFAFAFHSSPILTEHFFLFISQTVETPCLSCQLLRKELEDLSEWESCNDVSYNSLSFLSHMWDMSYSQLQIFHLPFHSSKPSGNSLQNVDMKNNIFPFQVKIGCINHIPTKMISDNLLFYFHLASCCTY